MNDAYDLDALKQKKYLFVGYRDALTKNLMHEFKNSSFLTNESTKLDSVKCDAVVFIIKHQSHSLYNKANKWAKDRKLPIVRFYNQNIDRLYTEMAKLA